VLQGLDEVGHEQRVVVELLGDRDSDLEAISRRLVLSRPEVLICLSNQLRHAFILRDAIRMGVRCLVSGTPLMSLGLPGVAEDNGQLVRVAMEHLFEKGHRRVGLALPRDNEPWVMERLEAYERMMVKVGETAEVWWTSARRLGEGEAEGMAEWIERGKLSAVIPSGAVPMHALDALVRMGRLSVPGDVSVVSFEPDHGSRGYLGHTQPTRVDLPLREMGGKLAELARGLVEGGTSAGVERMTGRLVEGSTTWLASGRMGR
jgi:DNA-binding LacI/PurR family transcriptional regulator